MMDKIDVKEAYKERKAPGSTAYPGGSRWGPKHADRKRELPEGVYGRVLPRDPHDTARASLLEPQSPTMKKKHPSITERLTHAREPPVYDER